MKDILRGNSKNEGKCSGCNQKKKKKICSLPDTCFRPVRSSEIKILDPHDLNLPTTYLNYSQAQVELILNFRILNLSITNGR